MLLREIIAAYLENYIWIRDRSLKFVVFDCQTHSQNYEKRLLISACLSGFRSVCLFRCLPAWNNSSPTEWIFTTFHLRIFTKSVEKIQASLATDKNSLALHEDLRTLIKIPRGILLWMRTISEKFVRNIKTHFMFHDIFRQSCRLWDDVDKYGRAGQATGDNIIRRRKESTCMQNNWGKNTDTQS